MLQAEDLVTGIAAIGSTIESQYQRQFWSWSIVGWLRLVVDLFQRVALIIEFACEVHTNFPGPVRYWMRAVVCLFTVTL